MFQSRLTQDISIYFRYSTSFVSSIMLLFKPVKQHIDLNKKHSVVGKQNPSLITEKKNNKGRLILN